MLFANVCKTPTVITANGNPTLRAYGSEIYRFQELLRFFIWRDSAIRYKQALLGAAWVVLRPLLTMLLFTFIFGFVARFSSEQVSYPLFVLAGMLPWQMYANSVNDTCNSLINYAHLINKAYFPRLLLPLSQIAVHLIDFGINLLIFVALSLYLGALPSWSQLCFFPLVIAWTFVLCVASAFWLAPLAARYRDVRFLVAFFIQFGMFLSPVGYGSFMIPEKWFWLYAFNPLVGLIDMYRWTLLGLPLTQPEWTLPLSLAITAILFCSGFLYFKRSEASLADVL
jgi:lipopolysaccharide transport system permease protein